MAAHSETSIPDRQARCSMERPFPSRTERMFWPNRRPKAPRRSSGRQDGGRDANIFFSVRIYSLLLKDRYVKQTGPHMDGFDYRMSMSSLEPGTKAPGHQLFGHP